MKPLTANMFFALILGAVGLGLLGAGLGMSERAVVGLYLLWCGVVFMRG